MYIQVQPDAGCLGASISLSGGRECRFRFSLMQVVMMHLSVLVEGGSVDSGSA